jgi:hypothetical protein
VAKLDASGTWLWAQRAGWNADDFCSDIDIDQNGDISLAGSFWGETRFGEISLVSNGDYDIFIAKLSVGVPVDEGLAPELSGLSCPQESTSTN